MTGTILSRTKSASVRKAGDRQERADATLDAMKDGLVVHHDDDAQHYNGTAKRFAGYRVRSRKDGIGGRYWWLEKLPEDDSAS